MAEEGSGASRILLALVPAWGKDIVDIRADLPTDGTYTVVCVGING